MPNSPPATRPFAAFEWMIALRYLRSKRSQGGVALISLLGSPGNIAISKYLNAQKVPQFDLSYVYFDPSKPISMRVPGSVVRSSHGSCRR